MTLLFILLLPFVGGLVCWQVERLHPRLPRWIALGTMATSFLLACKVWMQGQFSLSLDGVPAWATEVQFAWIPRFGITFHLAVDGLALLMVLLTGMLGVMAVLCSWREIGQRVGFFHLNLLWILGGVMGVFMALDLFLIFFFWEMMLVPMYFLIALWGHAASDGLS